MKGVVSSIEVLTQRIDTLVVLNRDIIRYLLIVVCIIALGRSALDLAKGWFGKTEIVNSTNEIN